MAELRKTLGHKAPVVLAERRDKAVIVALQDRDPFFEEHFEEFKRLVESAGAEVVAEVVQKRGRPDPATFIGKGKVEEVKKIAEEIGADLAIFASNLMPIQQRNLEDRVGVRVVDRTQLILDIFAQRARTKEGMLQVELAQLTYLLPRLTGRGVEMSRLGGVIGTRGPGETKLEVDRRRIRHRIQRICEELEEVRRHRELRRKKRRELGLPVVSLVGYTNAGKSTLFNRLTKADVYVDDRLFATLDPTVRRLSIDSSRTILLSDTVGFMRRLPPNLVAAFRATLEEVKEATALLHVVDASSPMMLEQMEEVERTLKALGAGGKLVEVAFNKIDLLDRAQVEAIRRRAERYPHSVLISALKGWGLEELKREILEVVEEARREQALEAEREGREES